MHSFSNAEGAKPGRHAILLYRLLALGSIGAAALGALLPLLPTTPFLLLALWASARGAPEWHQRIRSHPRFGPSIRAWQTQGAVSGRAKGLALACMATSWALAWLTGAAPAILIALAALFTVVGTFLVTRPAPSEIQR
ncbi:MAG: DUF454 family protein [Wenzhouxiangellaceae bacterium]|nr:DUF454 family protein [Wenzhouxiangellaceae bacterium]